MTGDEIILTIPAEQQYREVAHLVFAGVAARLDLTFEGLDDLETALDAVLERCQTNGEVTVKLRIEHGSIRAAVRWCCRSGTRSDRPGCCPDWARSWCR